jgi:hypothetical protein
MLENVAVLWETAVIYLGFTDNRSKDPELKMYVQCAVKAGID